MDSESSMLPVGDPALQTVGVVALRSQPARSWAAAMSGLAQHDHRLQWIQFQAFDRGGCIGQGSKPGCPNRPLAVFQPRPGINDLYAPLFRQPLMQYFWVNLLDRPER